MPADTSTMTSGAPSIVEFTSSTTTLVNDKRRCTVGNGSATHQPVARESFTREENQDRAQKRCCEPERGVDQSQSPKEKSCKSTKLIIPDSTEEWCGVVKSDDVHKVPRGRYGRLPCVYVGKSKIPNAGLGLFAGEDIAKCAKCTEYGGEIISHDTGKKLMETKEDTHCRSLSSHFLVIDGRVRVHEGFTKEWYCKHHKVGPFANCSVNHKHLNSKYVCLDGHPAYVQPYKNANPKHDLRCGQNRIFIVATRDIKKGDEIITNYDTGYFKRHNMLKK